MGETSPLKAQIKMDEAKKNVMKTTLNSLILATALLVGACDSRQDIPQPNAQKQTTKAQNSRPVIYYATWQEWGRAARDCRGWGLCKYEDCWGCDAPDDIAPHSGEILMEEGTNAGQLIIKLNPRAEEIQQAAIEEQWPFHVDQDIVTDGSVLHQGEYEFNPEIGEFGGYKIPITRIPITRTTSYIYWDAWGRSALNCSAGWGLCKYWDCWLCDEQSAPDTGHIGEILMEEGTNQGVVIIKLNPRAEEVQQIAIVERWTFHVDEYIVAGSSILHPGEYEFNPEIGEFGGYKIPITRFDGYKIPITRIAE